MKSFKITVSKTHSILLVGFIIIYFFQFDFNSYGREIKLHIYKSTITVKYKAETWKLNQNLLIGTEMDVKRCSVGHLKTEKKEKEINIDIIKSK